VQVCPKGIPLTSSIADMARATTVQSVKDWFVRDEGKAHGGPA
jgi:succinate dehydrogenase / fumarate reductase iron-sulfur subunit